MSICIIWKILPVLILLTGKGNLAYLALGHTSQIKLQFEAQWRKGKCFIAENGMCPNLTCQSFTSETTLTLAKVETETDFGLELLPLGIENKLVSNRNFD